MKWGICSLIFCPLIVFIILVNISCGYPHAGEKTISENIDSNMNFISENNSLLWVDNNFEFSTNDIVRAQARVPFTIILPTYLPYTKQRFPVINGPINCPGNTDMCEIRLTYAVSSGGLIVIGEWQYPSEIPEVQGREYVDIAGTQVLKDKNNTTFNFNSGGLGFNVYTKNVPGDEALKVVESIIKQTK